jgi:hypothetical protein
MQDELKIFAAIALALAGAAWNRPHLYMEVVNKWVFYIGTAAVLLFICWQSTLLVILMSLKPTTEEAFFLAREAISALKPPGRIILYLGALVFINGLLSLFSKHLLNADKRNNQPDK